MKKLLRVVGWIVLGVILLGAALAATAQILSDHKLKRVVHVEVAPLEVARDAAALARGKYLYDTRGCMECHGGDGGGRVVVDDASGFYVRSPNITHGAGSPVEQYKSEDWARTIRHGIKPNAHPLLVMPSEDYNQMTDEDLGAIVAYVETLKPIPSGPAEFRLPILVRALYVAGAIQDASEKVDHSLLPPSTAQAQSDPGAYLANGCRGCHGAGFSGGAIPGAPPSWPPAANLTSSTDGAMSRYSTVQEFAAMLRTGIRPDASPVSEVMPFESLKNLSDEEISSLFQFLKKLPSRPSGGR